MVVEKRMQLEIVSKILGNAKTELLVHEQYSAVTTVGDHLGFKIKFFSQPTLGVKRGFIVRKQLCALYCSYS